MIETDCVSGKCSTALGIGIFIVFFDAGIDALVSDFAWFQAKIIDELIGEHTLCHVLAVALAAPLFPLTTTKEEAQKKEEP